MAIPSRPHFDEAHQIVDGALEETRDLAQVVTTAGDVVYTMAQLQSAIILRDPSGGARTDTFPTAAAIIAGLKGPIRGTFFNVVIRNTADGAETITMAAGVGNTLASGNTNTVVQNNTKTFRIVVTSPTTCTIYSLGTVVH